MPSLQDLKKEIPQSEETKKEVVVKGDTLEECLSLGAEQLGVDIREISYDILQYGKKGFLGLGKKPFEVQVKSTSFGDEYNHKGEFPEIKEEKETSIDGNAKITIKKSGIFLRVDPPKEGGDPIKPENVELMLAQRSIKQYNKGQVRAIVKEARGENVKIGEWRPNPEYDSRAHLEKTPDDMKAYITVTAPILTGRVLEEDEILQLLDEMGIVYGIKHENIKKILDKEVYGVPILVAEGKEPQKGKNASIEYKFKTDTHLEYEVDEKTGKVDYNKPKEVISNVVAGQVLAVKTPPTKGISGRTITNKAIETTDGNDVELLAGENTMISDNGLEIFAKIAGRAFLDKVTNKVCVEKSYEVENVDYQTGNIIFLGTVIVKGDVKDGFSVKAAGNIEVRGNVEKAELEADGDIVIAKGVLGKGVLEKDGAKMRDGAILKAGDSVYATFIEQAEVFANNDVIVKENISHSKVDAGGRVICNGRRAYIYGGRIRASQEIYSKNIGIEAYTKTVIEAGIDPKSQEKLSQLTAEKNSHEETLMKINIKIQSLKELQKKEKLSEDKKTMLDRMEKAKEEFKITVEEIEQDIADLREWLSNLDTKGKISVKDVAYPGVEIRIKDAREPLRIKNEHKRVTFVYDNGFIRAVKFEELEDVKDD